MPIIQQANNDLDETVAVADWLEEEAHATDLKAAVAETITDQEVATALA